MPTYTIYVSEAKDIKMRKVLADPQEALARFVADAVEAGEKKELEETLPAVERVSESEVVVSIKVGDDELSLKSMLEGQEGQ